MSPAKRRLLAWAALTAGLGIFSPYAAGAVAVLGITLELAAAKWTRPDTLGWMALPLGVAVALLLLQIDTSIFRSLGEWGSDIAESLLRALTFLVLMMCLAAAVTLLSRLQDRRDEERRKGLRPYRTQTRFDRIYFRLAERISNFLTARMDAAERFDRHPIGRVVSIICAVLIFGGMVALYLKREPTPEHPRSQTVHSSQPPRPPSPPRPPTPPALPQ